MSNIKLNKIFKTMYCLRSYGFNLKEDIKNHLINKKVSIFDLGPFNDQSVDYPDYTKKLAYRIKQKKAKLFSFVVQGQVWHKRQ